MRRKLMLPSCRSPFQLGCMDLRRSRGTRRPSMHIGRTSTNIASCFGGGDALTKPLDDCALGFEALPSIVTMKLGGDLVTLLASQPGPLCMQPRRASSDPFLPVHFHAHPLY